MCLWPVSNGLWAEPNRPDRNATTISPTVRTAVVAVPPTILAIAAIFTCTPIVAPPGIVVALHAAAGDALRIEAVHGGAFSGARFNWRNRCRRKRRQHSKARGEREKRHFHESSPLRYDCYRTAEETRVRRDGSVDRVIPGHTCPGEGWDAWDTFSCWRWSLLSDGY